MNPTDLWRLFRVAEHIPRLEPIALTESEFTELVRERCFMSPDAPYVLNGRRVVVVPDRMMA